jgi:hypothetical protein
MLPMDARTTEDSQTIGRLAALQPRTPSGFRVHNGLTPALEPLTFGVNVIGKDTILSPARDWQNRVT